MKKIILILIILCTAGAAAYYYKEKSDKKIEAQAAYKITTVKTGNIEEVITSQGKLEAKEYVDVGTQVSGQLMKLHVALGDVVKKGDLIAEIDPKIYDSQVKATEGNLAALGAQKNQQQALVVQARQKYERNAALFKQDAISKEVYQDAETALNVAKAELASVEAQIEQASSTLKQAQTNLGYTKIYSPMDGTVVSQTSREGQTLNANQSAPIIVQVANLDVLTARAQVAEADIMNVKDDMPVYFTVLGSQDRKWQGKVRQVLPTPDVVNDVVLYNVLVDVDNKDRQLMLNMSTQMFFTVGRADNVLTVPVTALGKRMEGKDNKAAQAYMVKVWKNGQAADTLIHVGLMDRTSAQVIDGLAEGDRIAEPNLAKPAGGEDKARSGGGGMRGMPRL